jgi:hypothetical protein
MIWLMTWFEFEARKSTQAAAFLLALSGGEGDKYILLKMLYIADRKAIERWDMPITGDAPYSMEHGPVPSEIYSLTRGSLHHGDVWKSAIEKSPEDEVLKLINENVGTDELSQEEMALLRDVHDEFKDFSFGKMKSYCHKFPEYEPNVGKSSQPISISTMFRALGKSPDAMRHAVDGIIREEKLKAIFFE